MADLSKRAGVRLEIQGLRFHPDALVGVEMKQWARFAWLVRLGIYAGAAPLRRD
jgi:hypothetical protein